MLSGLMLIFGTIFFADRLGPQEADAFVTVGNMTRMEGLKYIFLPATALAAYVLGVINVTAANLVFAAVAKKAKDDLIIVSRIESLNRAQLLKETLDILNLRRTLIAFTFPLSYFGLMLALDTKQWDSKLVSVSVGIFLTVMGVFAAILAAKASGSLNSTLDELFQESLSNPK